MADTVSRDSDSEAIEVPSTLHISEVMAEALLQLVELEALDHRVAGYMAVLNSSDYVLARCCVPLHLMPISPDPSNRELSKRQWEIQMQTWRRDLRAIP
jgi:hypothetical protein